MKPSIINKIKIIKCRLVVALIAGLLGGLRAAAAGNGLSGINEATSMVTSYFDPGTKLIYAIGACRSYRRCQGLFQVVER